MERKLVAQGKGALTVTVPAKWTQDLNLSAGDAVQIQREGNKLIVNSGKQARTEKVTYKVESFRLDEMHSLLSRAYHSGFQEIVFKFKVVPKGKEILSAISAFTGLELCSQEGGKFTVKSYISTNEDEIDMLITKIFQVTKTLCRDFLDDPTKDNLKDLEPYLNNVQKLQNHCTQAITVNRYKGNESYAYFNLVYFLHSIARGFFYLADYITQQKSKDTEVLRILLDQFDKFYHAFIKKDFSETLKISSEHRNFTIQNFNAKNMDARAKKFKPGMAAHYYHMTMQLRYMNYLLIAICER